MSRRVCASVLAGFAVLIWLPAPPAPAGEVQTQSRTFQVTAGDRLSIQNDAGRVRIHSWESPEVRIAIERTASGSLSDEFRVSCSKSGREVLLHSHYSGQASERVNLDIHAPRFLDVSVSGSFVDVEVQGIEGPIRVQNVSGAIFLDGTTSSVSVNSTKADIRYRPQAQPRADVHLETTSGSIRCELPDNVSLRGSLRTGGAIRWGRDGVVRDAALEKSLGSGGPLLEARSSKGDILVGVGPAGDPQLAGAVEAVAPATPAPAAPAPAARQAGPPAPGGAAAPVPAAPPIPVPAPTPPRSQTRVPEPQPPAGRVPDPAGAPPVEGGSVAIKVSVDSVLLNVSVLDRVSNRSITGLEKDDFVVHEDGVRQEIEDLLPTEAPFSLLLLMDVSGSTEPYIRLMREAATDFVGQIKENDRIAVASFASRVQLLQNFTNDRNAATRAISRLHPGGGTAFYDALWTCVDQYMRNIQGRKAIVVFSDGVDNQLMGNRADGSHTTFDQLYRKVQEVDTIIYTIFLDSEGYTRTMTRGQRRYPGGGYPPGGGNPPAGRSRLPWPIPMPSPYPTPAPPPLPGQRGGDQRAAYEIAREQLETIAEQTGGRMYSPQLAEDLSGVYAEVAADLRIQYLLSYSSSNTGDGWRSVRVTIRGHPEAVVRTRKGYYARKST